MNNTCPCGKTMAYKKCCGRYLDGGEFAKTPEKLMRSRYCAYALGGYGDYLLSTWLPATADAAGLNADELSQKNMDWLGLRVISSSQHGDTGRVEFQADYKAPGSDQTQTMHEISEFTRINGRWLYISGAVT